jgi:5-methylcytosine-specific restriction protein A
MMSKLKMLQPRLATLDPFKNVKMLDTKKKPWLKLSDIKTDRWTKAGNGRLLPLNHAAWKKLRASVLAEEPLCRMCFAMGAIVTATCVDHINNDPSDNRRDRLQSLCQECHSRKTAKDMGHNVRMGCDKDGMPLDQGHHWNKPAKADLVRPVGAVVERSPATDGHEPISIPSVNAIC